MQAEIELKVRYLVRFDKPPSEADRDDVATTLSRHLMKVALPGEPENTMRSGFVPVTGGLNSFKLKGVSLVQTARAQRPVHSEVAIYEAQARDDAAADAEGRKPRLIARMSDVR